MKYLEHLFIKLILLFSCSKEILSLSEISKDLLLEKFLNRVRWQILRQTNPSKSKDPVSTKSIETCDNQELLLKFRGIILKKLTIKKIGDEEKCLTFRWVLVPMGGKKSGKMIDDNDYTYCPNKGFTKLVSRK